MTAQIRYRNCLDCGIKLCLIRYGAGHPLCQTCQEKEDQAESNRLASDTHAEE